MSLAPDYRLEDQIGFRLRIAHQRASAIFASVMADYDITPTQFAALVKIADSGRISQNELGRQTAMDPSTIWGVINRLQKRGLVATAPSSEDARMVTLTLTEDGAAMLSAMKARGLEVSARTLAQLSGDEIRLLLDLLQRIGEP